MSEKPRAKALRDPEIRAIRDCIRLLMALEQPARRRALDYVNSYVESKSVSSDVPR